MSDFSTTEKLEVDYHPSLEFFKFIATALRVDIDNFYNDSVKQLALQSSDYDFVTFCKNRTESEISMNSENIDKYQFIESLSGKIDKESKKQEIERLKNNEVVDPNTQRVTLFNDLGKDEVVYHLNEFLLEKAKKEKELEKMVKSDPNTKLTKKILKAIDQNIRLLEEYLAEPKVKNKFQGTVIPEFQQFRVNKNWELDETSNLLSYYVKVDASTNKKVKAGETPTKYRYETFPVIENKKMKFTHSYTTTSPSGYVHGSYSLKKEPTVDKITGLPIIHKKQLKKKEPELLAYHPFLHKDIVYYEPEFRIEDKSRFVINSKNRQKNLQANNFSLEEGRVANRNLILNTYLSLSLLPLQDSTSLLLNPINNADKKFTEGGLHRTRSPRYKKMRDQDGLLLFERNTILFDSSSSCIQLKGVSLEGKENYFNIGEVKKFKNGETTNIKEIYLNKIYLQITSKESKIKNHKVFETILEEVSPKYDRSSHYLKRFSEILTNEKLTTYFQKKFTHYDFNVKTFEEQLRVYIYYYYVYSHVNKIFKIQKTKLKQNYDYDLPVNMSFKTFFNFVLNTSRIHFKIAEDQNKNRSGVITNVSITIGDIFLNKIYLHLFKEGVTPRTIKMSFIKGDDYIGLDYTLKETILYQASDGSRLMMPKNYYEINNQLKNFRKRKDVLNNLIKLREAERRFLINEKAFLYNVYNIYDPKIVKNFDELYRTIFIEVGFHAFKKNYLNDMKEKKKREGLRFFLDEQDDTFKEYSFIRKLTKHSCLGSKGKHQKEFTENKVLPFMVWGLKIVNDKYVPKSDSKHTIPLRGDDHIEILNRMSRLYQKLKQWVNRKDRNIENFISRYGLFDNLNAYYKGKDESILDISPFLKKLALTFIESDIAFKEYYANFLIHKSRPRNRITKLENKLKHLKILKQQITKKIINRSSKREEIKTYTFYTQINKLLYNPKLKHIFLEDPKIISKMKKSAKGSIEEPGKNVAQKSKINYLQSSHGHSEFCSTLERTVKAKRPDVTVSYVNPAYTSKTCNNCGTINEDLKLGDDLFICKSCGNLDDRDLNASKNIRDKGIKDYKESLINTKLIKKVANEENSKPRKKVAKK